MYLFEISRCEVQSSLQQYLHKTDEWMTITFNLHVWQQNKYTLSYVGLLYMKMLSQQSVKKFCPKLHWHWYMFWLSMPYWDHMEAWTPCVITKGLHILDTLKTIILVKVMFNMDCGWQLQCELTTRVHKPPKKTSIKWANLLWTQDVTLGSMSKVWEKWSGTNVASLSRHTSTIPKKNTLILVWKTDLQAWETQLGSKNKLRSKGGSYPKITGHGL